MIKRTILIASLLLSGAASAQSSDEVKLVKSVLNQLQDISFRKNREYCGYIGHDEKDVLFASNARRGRRDSCLGKAPDNMDVIASYHTHGSFDPDARAEFPSVADLEGDEDEGIDGYISTPGGRLWYSDSQDMEVSQICGVGCMKQDPKFKAGIDGDIHVSYCYEELLAIEAK